MRRRGLVAALLALLALSGCRPLVPEGEKAINVYATFYPLYALTDALMADIPNARLHCLAQPQDGCLRSYQLSDWDARLLSTSADAVIAGGRGLESFESLLFAQKGDRGPAASAVLYNLELYDWGASQGETEGESHFSGQNPHLYMSVDGAGRMLEAITGTMIALDPRYGERYAANEAAAIEALDALSARMRGIIGDAAGGRVAIMNETLVYFARDCGLEVAGWVERESGTAFYGDEMRDCLDRLAGMDAKVVLLERQAPPSLAEALRENGYAVALIDILSTHREGEGFDTYIQAQENNARAVRRAFEEVNR